MATQTSTLVNGFLASQAEALSQQSQEMEGKQKPTTCRPHAQHTCQQLSSGASRTTLDLILIRVSELSIRHVKRASSQTNKAFTYSSSVCIKSVSSQKTHITAGNDRLMALVISLSFVRFGSCCEAVHGHSFNNEGLCSVNASAD